MSVTDEVSSLTEPVPERFKVVNTNRLRVLSGVWSISIANSIFPFTIAATLDSKFRNYRFKRVGSNLSYYEDGVFIETIAASSGTWAPDILCQSNSSAFLTGVIANVKIIDAGVPIHFWPLNSADPSTELDTLGSNDLTGSSLDSSDAEIFFKSGIDWLGVELVTIEPLPFGTNGSNTLTNITTNSFDIIGDATVFFGAEYNNLMVIGLSYKVALDTINNSGEIKVQSTGGGNELFGAITSTGSHSFIAVTDGDELRVARRTAGQPLNVECTNISLKRILQGAS